MSMPKISGSEYLEKLRDEFEGVVPSLDIRSHTAKGCAYPHEAHVRIGNGMHIDVDLSGKRYAMLCDATVTPGAASFVEGVFDKLGFRRDNDVRPC